MVKCKGKNDHYMICKRLGDGVDIEVCHDCERVVLSIQYDHHEPNESGPFERTVEIVLKKGGK